jgi:hypothetical protein
VVAAPAVLGRRLDNTETFELPEPLCEQGTGQSGRAPSKISLKLPQPTYRLRMISGVQRSAKISAPRAMGQYWPYVLITAVLRARLRL